MGILSGFKKFKDYIKTDSGYQLTSYWTSSKSVIMGDGTDDANTLETSFNNLKTKVDNCFSSVSNGKRLVANAITDKGVKTDANAEFATMANNINSIITNPTLQTKNAALRTYDQTITCDSGYDGLKSVFVPAVGGDAAPAHVLNGKTFNSVNGIDISGSMPDRNTTSTPGSSVGMNPIYASVPANPSVDNLQFNINTDGVKRISVRPLQGYYDGNSYVSIPVSLLGNSDTWNVLRGYTFTSEAGLRQEGTMVNYAGSSVTTNNSSENGGFSYINVPSSGYYDTNSKLRIPNAKLPIESFSFNIIGERGILDTDGCTSNTISFPVTNGKKYIYIQTNDLVYTEVKKNYFSGVSTAKILRNTQTVKNGYNNTEYFCVLIANSDTITVTIKSDAKARTILRYMLLEIC